MTLCFEQLEILEAKNNEVSDLIFEYINLLGNPIKL